MREPNYWTLERCKNESLKYKTKFKFMKGSRGAYEACYKNKWFNVVCKHMLSNFDARSLGKTYWTLEKCKNEALKYNTRGDFHNNSYGAYQSCVRRGLLDIVCKHMPEHATHYLHEKNIAQPMILSFLKKSGLKVEKEFSLSKNSKVDFLCTNKNNRKFIIEVKADTKNNRHSKINNQITKYKKEGKKKFGNTYAGTFLVSPNGTYGYSLSELKQVLKQKGLI